MENDFRRNTHGRNSRGRYRGFVVRASVVGRCWWWGAVGLIVLGSGCSSNRITIVQDRFINTAVHLNRPVDQRTGDPLEVSMVYLFPDDLEKEVNAGLRPGSGITSKGWYDNRPTLGSRGGFQVPADQIFLLTNDSQPYGTRVGRRLRGADRDGTSEVAVTGVGHLSRGRFKSGPILYVFPKFIGPQGQVLPVPPLLYRRPYSRSGIRFRVGVDPNRDHYGQYVERVTTP